MLDGRVHKESLTWSWSRLIIPLNLCRFCFTYGQRGSGGMGDLKAFVGYSHEGPVKFWLLLVLDFLGKPFELSGAEDGRDSSPQPLSSCPLPQFISGKPHIKRLPCAILQNKMNLSTWGTSLMNCSNPRRHRCFFISQFPISSVCYLTSWISSPLVLKFH